MRLLSYTLCAITLLAGTGIAATVDFSGNYHIRTPQGSMSLNLQQETNGDVSGSITLTGGTCEVSGVVVVDDEDDTSISGTMACAGGGGEFEFYMDDEDGGYYLLVTPGDASGRPRSDLTTLYRAQRQAGDGSADTGTGAASRPPVRDGAHDPRLVGVWSTQVIMNTPGGNMATQLLMAIRGDGTLVDLGSRAIGGSNDVSVDTGLSGGGGETVAWRTSGDMLEVSSGDSPWLLLARFEVSGDKLLFVYYDGDRKLWHRQ